MRRAIRILAFLLCAVTMIAPQLRGGPETVTMIDGIALMDYSRKPDFRVGDWAQYHVLGHSELGMKDNYVVTMLIGGQEQFWGDDGFWIETWTERHGLARVGIASLVSYAAFDDSLAVTHADLYARKLINGSDAEGNPIQNVRRRVEGSLKVPVSNERSPVWHFDTLGTDTVITPKGTFNCLKIRRRWGVGANGDQGDSTVRTEVEEVRTGYFTNQVPLTSLAREDIEKWIRRKTWKVGRSQDAPLIVREHTTAVARLMDFGKNLEAKVLPVSARKSFKRSPATENRTPAPKRKSAPRKGSG